MSYGMHALLGHQIRKVEISDDKQYLRFTSEAGTRLDYYADGDCCSHSWFQSIEGVAALLGGVVSKVEEIPMPPAPAKQGEYEYEDIKTYGIKLTTDKGRVVIEYRNSSNGYYGGMVLERSARGVKLTEVTEDFV